MGGTTDHHTVVMRGETSEFQISILSNAAKVDTAAMEYTAEMLCEYTGVLKASQKIQNIIVFTALKKFESSKGTNILASKCLICSVPVLSSAHKHKKDCLYTVAFHTFLFIKGDSYTCWIKRNIMMMYFCCIIYDGWPGRATVPEVMRLLIHYIRQIAGSLWRVFASEFYNSFLSHCVLFMLWPWNFYECVFCGFPSVCLELLLMSCFIYDEMAVLSQGLPFVYTWDELSCVLCAVLTFE